MPPTLQRSIPTVGAAGERYRPFLHSIAEPVRSSAQSGGRCRTCAADRAHRGLSAPSDRAYPGGLPISPQFFLWTCQGRYSSLIGMSIGGWRKAVNQSSKSIITIGGAMKDYR